MEAMIEMDTPENYCVNYQDGKWNFCANADICDDEGSISSTDPECTEKGSPCPENYIRYGDHSSSHRLTI